MALRLWPKKVVEIVENGAANFSPIYPDEMPLFEKIETIAKRIYRADEVLADNKIRNQLREWEEAGYGKSAGLHGEKRSTRSRLTRPCVAHPLATRSPCVRFACPLVRVFIVVVCGEIMTMPGLPRKTCG